MVSVFLNTGDGTFAPSVDYNASGGFLVAADVDRDGHLDLAAARRTKLFMVDLLGVSLT